MAYHSLAVAPVLPQYATHHMAVLSGHASLTGFCFHREVEPQEGDAGRGVQGLRVVPGSCHAGAGDPGLRSRRYLRHGGPEHAAGLAVHSTLRQEDCGLASGMHTVKTLLRKIEHCKNVHITKYFVCNTKNFFVSYK